MLASYNGKSEGRFSFKRLASRMYHGLTDVLPQSAPTEPLPDVKKLVVESGLTQSDLSMIYSTYQKLRREDGRIRIQSHPTLRIEAVSSLIGSPSQEVEILLSNILELGGCYEHIDWNHFVYIFIKFCSLTKVEVCQLFVLIIVRECKGIDAHYLTSAQLDRFYDRYRKPSIPDGMNCSRIHFSNFPLSRYYATDFVEICFLYGPLVNSILFLQRKMQCVFPSIRFWDSYNYLTGSNRKITLDYFLIKKQHLTMNTSAAFQETCDLLLLSSNLVHSKLLRGGTGSSTSKAIKNERRLELGFLSRNPTYHSKEDHSYAKISSHQQSNSLLRRKGSIGLESL